MRRCLQSVDFAPTKPCGGQQSVAISITSPAVAGENPHFDAQLSAPRINGVALDPYFIDRYIDRHRPLDQLAGAHVELRKMQRAFDQVADQLAARQRRVLMATHVPQRTISSLDIPDHDPFAVDRNPFDLARRKIADFGYRDKPIRHAPPASMLWPHALPASGRHMPAAAAKSQARCASSAGSRTACMRYRG
jgi:hypothetical protein